MNKLLWCTNYNSKWHSMNENVLITADDCIYILVIVHRTKLIRNSFIHPWCSELHLRGRGCLYAGSTTGDDIVASMSRLFILFSSTQTKVWLPVNKSANIAWLKQKQQSTDHFFYVRYIKGIVPELITA